ncbi:MAG: amino acid ABC transporter substrate-binding protein [Hyphomicrobiales bacterium]|nr:amino acid ABC transporter substrate-binding protein [Hyphomicrobiales bacterium]
MLKATLIKPALTVAFVSVLSAMPGRAEEKTLRIGMLGALSGALGEAAGKALSTGARMAVEEINARGGVAGYRIESVVVDAGSDIVGAVEQTERLLADPSIDLIVSNLGSAQCAAIAGAVDAAETFLWLTSCTASGILRDKNYRYVFRPHIDSASHAEMACRYLGDVVAPALDVEPAALKLAVVHEDGAYGSGLAEDTEVACEALGIPIALMDLFPTGLQDHGPIVERIAADEIDVVIHAAYYPDVVRFVRKLEGAGVSLAALIGQGGGYSHIDQLEADLGTVAVNYLSNVDPATVQLIDPAALTPEQDAVVDSFVARWRAEEGPGEIPSHASTGYNATWVLLTEVLLRATANHGGSGPDAMRAAALEIDIPEGGTIQGYGVKFAGADSLVPGQNTRAFPVVMQYHDGETHIVWPPELATEAPVVPRP